MTLVLGLLATTFSGSYEIQINDAASSTVASATIPAFIRAMTD